MLGFCTKNDAKWQMLSGRLPNEPLKDPRLAILTNLLRIVL